MYVGSSLSSSSLSRELETNLFGVCNHSKMLNGLRWVMSMMFEIDQLGFPLIFSEHIHQLSVFDQIQDN